MEMMKMHYFYDGIGKLARTDIITGQRTREMRGVGICSVVFNLGMGGSASRCRSEGRGGKEKDVFADCEFVSAVS